MNSPLRIRCKKVFFTPSNTGLKENNFPELGSVWKAAHVKVVMWFITQKACAIAADTGAPRQFLDDSKTYDFQQRLTPKLREWLTILRVLLATWEPDHSVGVLIAAMEMVTPIYRPT